MATYQLQPSYAYSSTHALYVEDHQQVEALPPPGPPPTTKAEVFLIDKYRVLDKRADKVSRHNCHIFVTFFAAL